MSFFDLSLWHMNRIEFFIIRMPHFCIVAAIVNAPYEVFIIVMPHILLWQPFIHLCGTRIGNRREFFIILMPHFCVVASF